MDELLLPAERGFGDESTKSTPNKEVASSDYRFPPWRQSEVLIPAIPPSSMSPSTSFNARASYLNLIANMNKKKGKKITLRRSHSAPSVFTEMQEVSSTSDNNCIGPNLRSTPSVVQLAFIGVLLYISAGVAVFAVLNTDFKGEHTVTLVDAVYFSMVTLCTIGYGDIVPDSTFTKLFTCAFILVGFGFVDILLNGLVTYVLDRQEAVLLSAVDENRFNAMFRTYMIDLNKRRMRIRMKVALALGVVIGFIAIGMLMIHVLEGLNWIDSLYLSITSVTTVGYGDYAFKTLEGRCFAIVWLLLSTLAVARAFLYLTEFRIDKRNRHIAEWVLQKKMTLGDLVAADLDNDGSISKSEYVIYKLKEMGKIAEKDIMQICNQFDRLDTGNFGKITVADLMENHH